MTKRKIYILSSTHWDREWYQTFQQYRFRLTRMMDGLLETFENFPDYKYYHLDGQTIPLKDYLEIRPENRGKIEKLIKDGRLLIGPWYCMPDEFLISGEALLRNLQRGYSDCMQWGVEPCRNGYVCDIFGHNTQLPQIFAGFDIPMVSLFRGACDHPDRAFTWQGADGTRTFVNVQHKDCAYSEFYFNARFIFDKKEELNLDGIAARVRKYIDEELPLCPTSAFTMIDGVDHIDVEDRIPQILNHLNKTFGDVEFIHSNNEDYLTDILTENKTLDVVEGPLYAIAKRGVNNALLKNVLSSQVHLKQDNNYCESQLTFTVEPYAMFSRMLKDTANPGTRYYRYVDKKGFIDAAWEFVLQNQPHDSICGCSITAVHEDNVNRFKQAKEIINTVKTDSLVHMTYAVNTAGKGKNGAVVVYNPSQNTIKGIREIEFEIQAGTHHSNFRFYNEKGENIKTTSTGYHTYSKKVANYNQLIEMPGYEVYTLALPLEIPPYGYTTITYDSLLTHRNGNESWQYIEYQPPQRNIGSMRTSKNTIDNGALVISVNGNGTINVLDKLSGSLYDNLLLFEDCADVGEGWNYIKPMFDKEYLSTASSAQVSFMCDSPDMVKLCITAEMTIPDRNAGITRSDKTSVMLIENILTVYKNERSIVIKTKVDNKHTEHRLRAVFETGIKTDKFKTSLPFDITEWDIEKEDNTYDKETDTFVNPNQGLISVSDGRRGLAVYNNGLYETAVHNKDSAAVYLTLFRSFPNEVAQNAGVMGRMLFAMTFDYKLEFFSDISDSALMKNANEFKNGLECVSAKTHEGPLGSSGSLFDMTGAAVLSGMRDVTVDGKNCIEIRIYDLDGGSEGEIALFMPVKNAFESDFRHIKTADALLENGRLQYKLANKQIKTFIIEAE